MSSRSLSRNDHTDDEENPKQGCSSLLWIIVICSVVSLIGAVTGIVLCVACPREADANVSAQHGTTDVNGATTAPSKPTSPNGPSPQTSSSFSPQKPPQKPPFLAPTRPQPQPPSPPSLDPANRPDNPLNALSAVSFTETVDENTGWTTVRAKLPYGHMIFYPHNVPGQSYPVFDAYWLDLYSDFVREKGATKTALSETRLSRGDALAIQAKSRDVESFKAVNASEVLTARCRGLNGDRHMSTLHHLFLSGLGRAILRAGEKMAIPHPDPNLAPFSQLQEKIQKGYGVVLSTPKIAKHTLHKPFEIAVAPSQFRNSSYDWLQDHLPTGKHSTLFNFRSATSGAILTSVSPPAHPALPTKNVQPEGHILAYLAYAHDFQNLWQRNAKNAISVMTMTEGPEAGLWIENMRFGREVFPKNELWMPTHGSAQYAWLHLRVDGSDFRAHSIHKGDNSILGNVAS